MACGKPMFFRGLHLHRSQESNIGAHASPSSISFILPRVMLRRWPVRRFTSVPSPRQCWKSTESPLIRRTSVQPYHSSTATSAEITPLRKQLKDVKRQSRSGVKGAQDVHNKEQDNRLKDWELTVGIEIHAQLNTSSKLFSRASAEYTDEPNAALWPFDLAVPGSQPLFQPPVLIPAIRAALALNCQIQRRSKFDRKHYFYHDQPAGYQITQYYEPLAKDGHITVTAQDGLGKDDNESLHVGIKQIQLEQDTAKTQDQDEETSLIDFNRSGHALIEIISLPHIHTPEAAAAYVRKIQAILYAVDATTTGMEQGGLRADVNVSVRRFSDAKGNHSYSGVTGLGQRTEIKNLSSFKSVEDAVRAERDRQIDLIESGGAVEGETRGWSLSNAHVTRRLRGKEGEVDYRYMPDPDISPLYIDQRLINHFRQSLPPVPEQLLDMLRSDYGLTIEDAKALLSLDDGDRLLFYQDVVARLRRPGTDVKDALGGQVGNWVLHELGAVLTTNDIQWASDLIHPQQMADLINMRKRNEILGSSSKRLLEAIVKGDKCPAAEIAERENLLFRPITNVEYDLLATKVIQANPDEAEMVRQGHKKAPGKLKYLLGQMLQLGDRSRMEAQKAEEVLKAKLTPVKRG